MQSVSRLIFLFLFILLFSFSLRAKIILPSVFSDGMVLQQNAYVAIWGRAQPGEAVTITASWDGFSLTTITDSRGKWRIEMPTPAAGGPWNLRFEGENEVVLKDILTGEVWLVAEGWADQEEGLDLPAETPVRLFQVEPELATTPRFDCRGSWRGAGTSLNLDASSKALVQRLMAQTQLPIGLLMIPQADASAQAWMSRGSLEADSSFQSILEKYNEEVRSFEIGQNGPGLKRTDNPTTIFNAMIAPLTSFEIRGVLWMQGKSNLDDPWLYRKLFPALLADWRKQWRRNLLFAYTLLPSVKHPIQSIAAGIREGQLALHKQAGTQAVMGRDAIDAATNLAEIALTIINQQKPEEALLVDRPVRIANRGSYFLIQLHPFQTNKLPETIQDFEVAGPDLNFVPAQVEAQGDQLKVSATGVEQLLSLRYGFQNDFSPEMGILPFRMDDWPIFFHQPEIEIVKKKGQLHCKIISPDPSQRLELRYSLNKKSPTPASPLVPNVIALDGPTHLMVRAFKEKMMSDWVWEHKIIPHESMFYPIVKVVGMERNEAEKLLDGIRLTGKNDQQNIVVLPENEVELVLDVRERKALESIELGIIPHTTGNKSSFTLRVYRIEEGKKDQLLAEGTPGEIWPPQATLKLKNNRSRYLKMVFSPREAWKSYPLRLDEIIIR